MSKISHTYHAHRSSSQVYFCLALLLLSLQLVRAATSRIPASPVPVQGKVSVVGLLPFQDETDSGAPSELGKKLAVQLKQRLLSFKDVLPKSLSLNSDAPSTAGLSVEQAVALGKQNAVQFVIRGGILALAVTESNVTAELYAEIISVESGAVSVVRAQGTGAGGSIQWSALDLNSASFSSSAPGAALAAAIESLATSIHQALMAPAADVSPGETSGSSDGAVEPASPAEAAAADTDEELRQLIAQAEEVVASGAGDADRLQPVSSALETLKAALASKAALIEGGADPAASDREMAIAKTELQAALTALTEQAASGTGNSDEATPPTSEKKGLLGAIDKRAGEAIGLLQKIQQMRAAVRAVKDGPTGEASEQPTEDVSGVVMEAGQPVAGVEVAVENSDASVITGPDGSYTLKALPAGKLSKLVLKKNGKQLAAGQINPLRGRPAVADFDVKSSMAPAASALRIIPSTIVLKANPKAGATGTLKGVAKDAAGNPLGRALVKLQGQAAGDVNSPMLLKALVTNEAAVARTDSQGRYTFHNVPVGERLVTIQKIGLKPISIRVSVKPNVATETQSQLIAAPRNPARDRQRATVRGGSPPSPTSGGVKPLVISRDRVLGNNQTSPRDPERTAGSTTGPSQPRSGALRGQVVDGLNRRPIAGATVLIAGRRAKTDQAGNYELADLAPGNYQARVTSSGFSEDQQSVTIRAGASSREEFVLQRLADSNRTVRAISETPRVATPTRLGQARGRVVDATSGAPIVGAVVAVSGGQSAVTGRDGSYSLNALPPGSYQVSISRAGFTERRTVFTVRAGEVTDASFRLTAISRRPTR